MANHDPMVEAYVRAMKRERKGPHDPMGWLGKLSVWWDLDLTPKSRSLGEWL